MARINKKIEIDKRKLNKILEKIIKYYSPKKVILFGSMARCDNVYSSDVDIMVIADSDKSFIERLKESVFSVPDDNVDILIYTPEEFATMIKVENQFITNVIKEGKIIYESQR